MTREFKSKLVLFGAVSSIALAIGFGAVTTLHTPVGPTPQIVTRDIAVARPEGEARRIAPQKIAPLVKVAIEAAPEVSRATLARVYEANDYEPLWIGRKGATKRANALWQVQMSAESHAIGADKLGGLLEQIPVTMHPDAVATLDVGLTLEALRLAEHMRGGAISVRELGVSWKMPAESFDVITGFVDAVKHGHVAAYFESLPPADPQYAALIAGLQRYRALAATGGWPQIEGGKEIKLDGSDNRAATLERRLAIEGYLQIGEQPDLTRIVEAVRVFQARNGLKPDGRVGKGTIAALNISADQRVAQIAANLERRRHTPRDLGERYIAVNTAGVHLDVMVNGESTLRLKGISGLPAAATPILSAEAVAVTFNPRWNVPSSIARKEILAKLKRNPNYLADNNMVIVGGVDTDDPSGRYHDWSQYSVNRFPVRIRQKAGADNALGLIKVEMPNQWNIYLHDTPSRKLFARDDRHLSHGCVRVENPSQLAAAILGSDDWSTDRVDAAVATGKTQSVRLQAPLPVHIFYWTAYLEDGALQFRADAYGRDAPLAEKLGVRPEKNPLLIAAEG